MSRTLGIDYGDVRVGLAISDELGITAQGIDTFVANGNINKLIKHIKQLIDEYNIDKLIIGYPRNMNGTMSEKTKKVDEVVEKIKEKINIDVIKWDERLTTVSAYKTDRKSTR